VIKLSANNKLNNLLILFQFIRLLPFILLRAPEGYRDDVSGGS
jgi:hypothetical protein